MNTTGNWIKIALACVLALTVWVLDPAFVATEYGLSEKTFGIVKLIATGLALVIGVVQSGAIMRKKGML